MRLMVQHKKISCVRSFSYNKKRTTFQPKCKRTSSSIWNGMTKCKCTLKNVCTCEVFGRKSRSVLHNRKNLMMLNCKAVQVASNKRKRERVKKFQQSSRYAASAIDSPIECQHTHQKQCTSLKKHCTRSLNKKQSVS